MRTDPLASVTAERAPLLLHVGLFLSYLGSAVLRPVISGSLAPVDALLGVLCAYGVWSMTSRGSTASRCLVRVLPWFWLILVGSFLGLMHVGVTRWAIQSLLQTTLALLTFFAVWHLIEVGRLLRTARFAVLVATVVSCIGLLVVSYSYRASGWFRHPNYAGHFGIMAAAVLISVGTPRMRIFGFAAGAMVLWTTASFGAMAMALVMIVVTMARAVERYSTVLLLALVGLVAATALFLLAPQQEVETESGSWEVKGVISEERFDRSQSGREDIWSDAFDALSAEPFGLGPGGVSGRDIYVESGRGKEIHSDVIGFLVERGVIGLIGLIGVWATIWRNAAPGGLARLLIAASVMSAVFREVIHYRHMWLFIALAMAFDHLTARRDGVEHGPSPGTPQGDYPQPTPIT